MHIKGVYKLFFGIKTKVIPYPDNYFVLWVTMFATYNKGD